jgi:hypothetical protein
MKQVVIENPVINSPFDEPCRHFRFSDEGITNEIVSQRRVSSYFIPIAKPKKKGKDQLYFETEWTQDRIEENKFINQVRTRVKQWREAKHFGVTRTTAQLLQYWIRPERERRLFFCQIEALETLIYLSEVAKNTEYNGESFFVRHAYFTGADEPYEKLKRALRADIDEAAWQSLYSSVSRPFDKPSTGKIAIKVINHYGDEVLKVFPMEQI